MAVMPSAGGLKTVGVTTGRVMLTAAAGALLAVAGTLVAYAVRPTLTLELDRPSSVATTGFHPDERVGQETYAWTRRSVDLRLTGLDRRTGWTCVIRLKGGRADLATLPEVAVTVDGIVVTRQPTTNDYLDVSVPVPPAPRPGATVTLTVSNTFRPPDDPRDLGVMVDRWQCAPDAGAFVVPPRAALQAAGVVGAAFGVSLVLLQLPWLWVAAILAATGGISGLALGRDLGAFGTYPETFLRTGLGIAAALLVSALALRWRSPAASRAFRVACAVSAVILLFKLTGLLHPSKLIIDAVFHAHRLQWVLEGRFYFTQLMPSGVQFPYAIGLYVFAAPWTLLTADFVTLLRVVVVSAEVLAGLAAWAMLARCWADRTTATVAVLLLGLVPRTFEIVGNANMTNAFGQSMAFLVVAAAVLSALRWRDWAAWSGFTALTAAALLCHISTLTLLGGILVLLAAAYALLGPRDLRGPALTLVTALAAATVLAVAVYYGHFLEAYRSAARVTSAGPDSVYASLTMKAGDVARLTVAGVGWPIFLLGLAGAVDLWRARLRDRLSLAVVAWAGALVALGLAVILMPVEQSFQRYNAEFYSRVTLATYPALVICAARGVTAGWRRGGLWRWGAALAVVASLSVGVSDWLRWLE